MPILLNTAIKHHPRFKFKPISEKHFDSITKCPQDMLSDCYLVSTLKTLAKSQGGQKLLKKSIFVNQNGDAYKTVFNGANKNNSFISRLEFEYLYNTDRHSLNPTGAVENGMNKFVAKHFFAKPIVYRLLQPFDSTRNQNNNASKFMKYLTGKTPNINIGEGHTIPLLFRKNKVMDLLNQVANSKSKNHSLVAGTNVFTYSNNPNIHSTHYYVINNFDKEKKLVNLTNPRDSKGNFDYTLKGFLKNFRCISGYLFKD